MDEIEYLERRAAVEARMAQDAECAAAKKAHEEMSEAYAASAAELRRNLQPRLRRKAG